MKGYGWKVVERGVPYTGFGCPSCGAPEVRKSDKKCFNCGHEDGEELYEHMKSYWSEHLQNKERRNPSSELVF